MSGEQIPIDPEAETGTSLEHGLHEVAPDLAYQRLTIVNVVYAGLPGAGDRRWILVDAGIPDSAGAIRRAAADHFGPDARPAAIVLTHGHFDHVGALKELAEEWDTPIIAHRLEYPYLNGRSAYPPPDPTVGGGIMSALSGFYPRGPLDVSPWLHALPDDGSVPYMQGWIWLHTPGHTPGHISLWRESDRSLIAGDAFITTRQESAYAVLTQKPELHGPPMYFTSDWRSARESVVLLASLQPERVITGHGPAMRGRAMREALSQLARDFDQVAVPKQGRYVHTPARANKDGVTYVPPKP
ncbi:MAG: MBL fold metallo-hydrolase [Caldilineaceae bacterium]|nr:MBL fold metallo-hydrolase [Caldilineaceae bacterium]